MTRQTIFAKAVFSSSNRLDICRSFRNPRRLILSILILEKTKVEESLDGLLRHSRAEGEDSSSQRENSVLEGRRMDQKHHHGTVKWLLFFYFFQGRFELWNQFWSEMLGTLVLVTVGNASVAQNQAQYHNAAFLDINLAYG